MNARIIPTVLAACLIGMFGGCGPRIHESTLLTEVAPPLTGGALLSAHLHSGELLVFTRWDIPAPGSAELNGFGTRYGSDRAVLDGPAQRAIALDSIALLEANNPETVAELGTFGLMAWAGLNAVVSVICLADPKSCFGSCPTFYMNDPSGEERLVAEGFSSSFARVLEARDIDALPAWSGAGDALSIVMRNEAHETHAVRELAVLAVPRNGGETILATGSGEFRPARGIVGIAACKVGTPDGADCVGAVQSDDGIEYFSPASDVDLGEREYLYVQLPSASSFSGSVPPASPGAGELGLVIRARATLVSTYLFYESIAALGPEAGAGLALLERGDPAVVARSRGIATELGGIEIQVEGSDGWVTVGEFAEAGPIAADLQVVPMGEIPTHATTIRLRMAKGSWRIDYLALARLEPETAARRLEPVRVVTAHAESDGVARTALRDPDRYLITQRGDVHEIVFDLSDLDGDHELFLESRGYYYEWMRDSWLAEPDPGLAALIFGDPARALRVMAPAFARNEAEMESLFWSSRFRRDEP